MDALYCHSPCSPSESPLASCGQLNPAEVSCSRDQTQPFCLRERSVPPCFGLIAAHSKALWAYQKLQTDAS